MDPRHLSRLHEEQNRALEKTKERIGKYEKFKSDYRALQQKLKTLPDKLSHDVMVPFGKFAFMPGQIVHTNEILVLLGDNWFAERSAKQAYHIAERRIQELDERIKDLQKQHDLLSPRLGITSDLQAEAQCFGDVKEIVEEYDEEKERQWDEQHRKNMRRYHTEQKKKNLSGAEAGENTKVFAQSYLPSKSDEELWKRLNALEEEEAAKGELNSSFEEESEDEDRQFKGTDAQGRRVSWIDEKAEDAEDSDDLSENNDDDDGGTEGSGEDSEESPLSGNGVKRTITFSHSERPAVTALTTQLEEATSRVLNINSPADIYKLYVPKSILKKSHSHSNETLLPQELPAKAFIEEIKITDDSGVKSRVPFTSRDDKAFTGRVIEKSSSENTQTKTEAQGLGGPQETKRVSKFKAQRMKQAPS